MAVLNFDKTGLGNLEYSLQREMLSTNRAGGYMSTTMVCCNTRKYHGLMVCPISDTDDKNYVLLSSVDETVIQNDQEFNLALHRFPGKYEPRGHKYMTDFSYTVNPAMTYRVGGVILKKELLWIHSRTQLLIKYTLLEATSRTLLRLRPFLAFRQNHGLSKANLLADGRSFPIPNGVKCRLYTGFPWLHMQVDTESEFVHAPDWYYNFQYLEEMRRGYPYEEDLLTTGYFETEIRKGQSIIFSCSTEEADASALGFTYNDEVSRRTEKKDLLSCLRHSARQFIVKQGNRTELVAGYPWFGRWGRDTFIALPGITLTQGNVGSCEKIIDTMLGEVKGGLFPNMGDSYNSVDAPMWFFWTLQALGKHLEGRSKEIWKRYGGRMKDILDAYIKGIGDNVAIHDNGLIWATHPSHAITWMDAVVDGKPVTAREGYQVEINALWYNAICYTVSLAAESGDDKFAKKWGKFAEKVKKSFTETFWYEQEGYLADYVDGAGRNTFIRPNQIIACSLPYTMLSDAQKLAVIGTVKKHLLTPKGLRTLSPRNPLYKGHCEGDQPTRDRAYHQGTVWPWLLEHYVKANFDMSGVKYLHEAEEILTHFDEDMTMAGIGSISEIYDGDPPHTPRGCISQAWSVGAVLRIDEMIKKYRA